MRSLKARLRALTALAMAALLLLTISGPALAASALGGTETVPWDEMEYEHYDPTQFKADLEDLSAAAAEGDTDKALALYDALYEEFVHIYTLNAISYIHNSQDVNDEYWADELVYNNTLNSELGDALMTVCSQMMKGPCAQALADRVGEHAAREMEEYVPKTPREVELTARETDLITQYYVLMDGQDDVVYEYEGEEWTLPRLKEEGGTLTGDAYDDILYGIFDILAQDVGKVFLELVSVRTELAHLMGYEDYNELVYEEIYPRPYTTEQAQTLFEQAQVISREFANGLEISPVAFRPVDCRFPLDSQEQMLDVLHRYAGQVDPVFDDSWQFLTENGLCDIAAGPGRAAGAFTIDLPAFDCAFIYGSNVGSPDALETLFHEFGHFTATVLSEDYNVLTDANIPDLAEVHSTGLELLSMRFFDDLYGEDADTARFNTLSSALSTVTSQSMYAQFEAEVYAHPDMTLEQIGLTYDRLMQDYGYGSAGRPNQTWIMLPHFFATPDYIVSYVTATMAALQIWAAAEEDWQAGADIYRDILQTGYIGADYFQVLESVGLASFTEPGTVETVCRKAMDALAALEEDVLFPGQDGAEDEAPAGEAPADVLDVETQGLMNAGAAPADEKPDVLG